MATDPKAIAVFQGVTVQRVADDLAEYDASTARILILKDGNDYYLQVKSATGDGGDPLNDSHPCPGSPGCP